MTFRNRDRLGFCSSSQEGGEQSVQPRSSLLGIVVDCEDRSPQKMGCSTGDETGGLYLFLWPAQLVCFQGMLIGFGGWENGWVGRRKFGGEGLCDPLEMRSEKKGRPQQIISSQCLKYCWLLGRVGELTMSLVHNAFILGQGDSK